MSKTLGWGILGTGNIARQFATGVAGCRRGRLVAIGSRHVASANQFAAEYAPSASSGDYQQVLENPAVDAVYVALPNNLHHPWTIAALRAGKHVLCEKPFAVSSTQAMEMIDVARQCRRVLIEAFMYRCHPLTDQIVQTVRSGRIGQVQLIRSSFCFRTSKIDQNIRFDPQLAGGALMDIGCYCINFSRLIAGTEPRQIWATGHLHERGVDELAAGMMQFPDDILASFTCGMTVQADNTTSICGSEGFIEIPVPWKPPADQAEYTIGSSTPPRMDTANSKAPTASPRQTYYVDAGGMHLYALEADRFAATVLDGLPPFISHEDTVGNMRVLEEMIRQIHQDR